MKTPTPRHALNISLGLLLLAGCNDDTTASTETGSTETGDGDGDPGDGDGDGDAGDGDGDGDAGDGDGDAGDGDGDAGDGDGDAGDGDGDAGDGDGEPQGFCGDGVADPGEECDDGNQDDDDECTNACTLPSCGDGILQEGEACDDGNFDDDDDCPTNCQPATCGDGFVWADNEECDDGNDDNTDDCLDTCEAASCGDGFVWADNEECDDGNVDNTDDCIDTCEAATCGDGFVWAGNEDCDDGNLDPNDGCSPVCEAESCWSFTNTNQADLAGIGWFDACVNAPGNNVTLTVRDVNDNIVYQASGVKVGNWTFDQLTSTAGLFSQYDVAVHDRIISLDNGDLLRISGKNSDNGGCGGSQGNGYVIMVYDNPISSTYYDNIKLLIAPHLHTVSNNSPRNFGNWTAAGEISWNNDMNMFSCHPFFGPGPALTPFLGSASFRVF